MNEVIVVGARAETAPYAAAGLTCFEPEFARLAERVLAERARCAVLAMTPLAFGALPEALAQDLRLGVRPTLAIVPAVCDASAASRVADGLMRIAAGRKPAAA